MCRVECRACRYTERARAVADLPPSDNLMIINTEWGEFDDDAAAAAAVAIVLLFLFFVCCMTHLIIIQVRSSCSMPHTCAAGAYDGSSFSRCRSELL